MLLYKEREARVVEAKDERIKAVGLAEAKVIRNKGIAEAEAITKRVEALNRLQEEGRSFRSIEKDE